MKKIIIIILFSVLLSSCVNQMDRLTDAQKKYPKCIVQPTTYLLSNQGYEIMIEDTISDQIYAIDYWPFSTTKIRSIRNIK